MLIVETAADRRAGRERAERAGQSERMGQAERAARARALESLAERLTLVAEITDVLGHTLEVDEALARLSRSLAPGGPAGRLPSGAPSCRDRPGEP
ncbi:hypothetical protein GCM10010206_62290 [Streptomyces cinerochromogenes]|nr:hypothetical protein GCM10010206_62290 [Streptomyces cinerochromogenes]